MGFRGEHCFFAASRSRVEDENGLQKSSEPCDCLCFHGTPLPARSEDGTDPPTFKDVNSGAGLEATDALVSQRFFTTFRKEAFLSLFLNGVAFCTAF